MLRAGSLFRDQGGLGRRLQAVGEVRWDGVCPAEDPQPLARLSPRSASLVTGGHEP